MIEADARKFGDRDGQNGEIDAGDTEAERQETDKSAGTCGNRHCNDQPQPRTKAKMHIERSRGIRAEPDIERMTERQLPGKAHHDVPTLSEISKIQDQYKHGEQIVAGEQRGENQSDQKSDQRQQGAARQICDQARDHAVLLPMMPCGRNSSTSTRMPKANMLLADGENSRPAIASVSPISTPPRSAPGIEPSPPVMTMTKASKV